VKKIKESRAASFVAVFAVYLIAAAVGILSYLALDISFWCDLLIADAVATAVTFIFSLIFKNASVYDPYWSVQPAVILFCFALQAEMNAARLLLLFAVFFWAIRLTANWAYTFRGLMHQDWRYTMLAEKTGAFYPVINFIGIHMVPTLVVYATTLPAVFAFVYDVRINVGAVIFALLSVFAAILQLIADVEMQSFRKSGKGGFIRVGLWRNSRHPNYLGEILMWWGIGLSVLCMLPEHPYLISGAVLNTLLFAFVSIPMAEGRQSKKEGFDEYRRQTHVLLPVRKFGKGK